MPPAVSVGFSAGLLRFEKRLFAEVDAGAGAELDVVALCAPRLKKLGAVVVGVDDSAGLDVEVGKLKEGLDALDPAFVAALENNDGALVWADVVGAVDCSPMLGNKGFEASLWGVDTRGEKLGSFCLPRLLNKLAIGCASGLLPNKPELALPAGCENMLVLDCDDVAGGFDSVGWLDGNSPPAGVLLAFPNRVDPPELFDVAGALAEFGAEDCGCCVVDPKPKDKFDGGGPAGVVDGFPNKPDVGLLVGVAFPNGAAIDVFPPALPNRPAPLVVPPPNRLDAWLVAGDFGC